VEIAHNWVKQMMNEENYITFAYPKCGNSVEYLEDYAGTAQPCPFCGEDIIVANADGTEGHSLPLPLSTPRLILRRLTPDDLPDILEIITDPEVYRYEERGPLGEVEGKQWLEVALKQKLSDGDGKLSLGITQQNSGKLVGILGLRYRDRDRRQVDLGIQINRSYQGQGFGSEALVAILIFCLRDIGLHRVTAGCDCSNVASVRLLTKVGMRKEAEYRKDRFVDGEWVNSCRFAMLDEDIPRS
jgi:[ribosomal protein S5]-alanine N-acetyltransferase